MAKVGRPRTIELDGRLFSLNMLEKLGYYDHTDKEIADILGVSESTLNLYKKRSPEFSESINKGKRKTDEKVIDSLYKRATGIKYKETKVIKECGIETRTEVTNKFIPPDTAAARYWLNNRRRSKFADRVQQDITSGGEKIQNVFVVPAFENSVETPEDNSDSGNNDGGDE